MSKQANELLSNLLASGIDAAGAHCSPVDPDPSKYPHKPPRKGYEEPDEKDKDKKIDLF